MCSGGSDGYRGSDFDICQKEVFYEFVQDFGLDTMNLLGTELTELSRNTS